MRRIVKFLFLSLAILSASAVMVSCEDKEDEPKNVPDTYSTTLNYELRYSVGDVVLSEYTGLRISKSDKVTIDLNLLYEYNDNCAKGHVMGSQYAIVSSPYWINAEISYDYYPERLVLNVSENTSSYERSGTITVSASSNWAYADFEPREKSLTITQAGASGGSGGGSNGGSSGGSGGNGGASSSDPVWGKVTATTDVTTTTWGSYLEWVDGQTCTIDYVYYPTTDKYYIYGGPFCSDPDANGGKGIRYNAHKRI